MTDYAVVLTTHMASSDHQITHHMRELANDTGIPQPTVSKVLKHLTRAGVLESQRGARGGYRLARAPEHTNIAEVIMALEGPIGVTECTADDGCCELEGRCDVRANWQRINEAVYVALSQITLAEMARPATEQTLVHITTKGQRDVAAG